VETLIDLATAMALSCGFSHVKELKPATIKTYAEVRAACADDKCGAYGKNWACPPLCGELDECAVRLKKYSTGLLLQSTGILEDEFDFEAMTATGEEHGKRLLDFAQKIRGLGTSVLSDALILGAGACKRCEKCAAPDAPCRFPDKMISSMEAFGMIVSEVCSANDLPYYYGKGTLTYVGCALFT
jgi:predicted metal-binding protein